MVPGVFSSFRGFPLLPCRGLPGAVNLLTLEQVARIVNPRTSRGYRTALRLYEPLIWIVLLDVSSFILMILSTILFILRSWCILNVASLSWVQWVAKPVSCLGPAVDRPFQLVSVVCTHLQWGQQIGKLVQKRRPTVQFLVNTSTVGWMIIDQLRSTYECRGPTCICTTWSWHHHDIPMISPASLVERLKRIHNETGLWTVPPCRS